LLLALFFVWPKQYSETLDLAMAISCVPITLAGFWFSAVAVLKVGLSTGVRHLANALSWGWPLLASAALSMGIASVSRIYSFSHLGHSEQIALNFWLRVFSIVQLSHAVAMTALSLEIFQSRETGLLRTNAMHYMQSIGGAFILVVGLLGASTVWSSLAPAIDFIAFAAIGAFTLTWCIGAYLEIYLTRDGRAGIILKIGMVTSIVYLILIAFISPDSLKYLSLIMAISTILSLTLLARATFSDYQALK
jgi:hypothetical protein